MQGRTYAYVRVSTADQNLARQLDAVEGFGVDPALVYADKASGKDFDRPQWARLKEALAEGDTLVVPSIDRFGRNYDEILWEWHALTKVKGVSIVVLDMPLLDTRERVGGVTGAVVADIVLQLLSYVAQVERENIKARQRAGIDAALARGVRFGRPRAKRPASYEAVKRDYVEGRTTRKRASAELGVCKTTFDKWLREDGAARPRPRGGVPAVPAGEPALPSGR